MWGDLGNPARKGGWRPFGCGILTAGMPADHRTSGGTPTVSDQSASPKPIATQTTTVGGQAIDLRRRAAACTQMRSPAILRSSPSAVERGSVWGTSLPCWKPRWPSACCCGEPCCPQDAKLQWHDWPCSAGVTGEQGPPRWGQLLPVSRARTIAAHLCCCAGGSILSLSRDPRQWAWRLEPPSTQPMACT